MQLSIGSLILSSSRDERKKAQLRESIIRKRERLLRLITKNELLKVELKLIQREYTVRIGSLYLRDNQLDLEIIHYKNILRLIEEGTTYEEAVLALQQTFYAEQLVMDQEQERIRQEERIFQRQERITTEEEKKDIKKLWKKLIAAFHPDLVSDSEEKKRREKVVKQINIAYEEHDLTTLVRIEQNSHIEKPQDTTIERLEEILVAIENEIIQQVKMYYELCSSEWYGWKERIRQAKKRSQDVFRDFEKSLLDDILKKIRILKDLQAQV